MANEYRATLAGAEVLQAPPSAARASLSGAEALQADAAATLARVSAAGAEALQVDDAVTDIRATFAGVEVLRSIDDASPGTSHFATLALTGAGSVGLGGFVGAKALRLAFAALLRLEVRPTSLAVCASAPAKAWARLKPAGKGWGRTPPAPAEDCQTGPDAPVLACLDGTLLIDLAGDRLELIG